VNHEPTNCELNMQYTHIQKNINSSPRKLRLVADMVRKMSPEQAVLTLQFTQKSAALPLLKAIQTAIANAGKKDNLNFDKLEINEGLKMRRFRAAPRGRVRPYKKRFAHIRIVLTDEITNIQLPISNKKAKEEPYRVETAGLEEVKESADVKSTEMKTENELKENLDRKESRKNAK
jgi:large subunit ribosomal protein L22